MNRLPNMHTLFSYTSLLLMLMTHNAICASSNVPYSIRHGFFKFVANYKKSVIFQEFKDLSEYLDQKEKSEADKVFLHTQDVHEIYYLINSNFKLMHQRNCKLIKYDGICGVGKYINHPLSNYFTILLSEGTSTPFFGITNPTLLSNEVEIVKVGTDEEKHRYFFKSCYKTTDPKVNNGCYYCKNSQPKEPFDCSSIKNEVNCQSVMGPYPNSSFHKKDYHVCFWGIVPNMSVLIHNNMLTTADSYSNMCSSIGNGKCKAVSTGTSSFFKSRVIKRQGDLQCLRI